MSQINSGHGQRGAMFGLDARIALAIFSLLAVVAGVAMVTNLSDSRAKGLAAELAETGKAIEAFHADVQDDIFMVLIEPTEARAFQALYDNTVVDENRNYRGKWNGPYVRAAGNVHPEFGEQSIQKRLADHTQNCDASEGLCFLWLVYSRVKPDIVKEVNKLLDSPSEATPATQGRVQWSQEDDATQILYYRVAKALAVQ
jgi:hypothetical protein